MAASAALGMVECVEKIGLREKKPVFIRKGLSRVNGRDRGVLLRQVSESMRRYV